MVYPFQNPDLVRRAGPNDPELIVVAVETANGDKAGLIVNFALHLDTVGGDGVSADYPAVLAEEMRKAGYTATLFLNGACGNVNHLDFLGPEDAVPTTPQIGRRLAEAVQTALKEVRPVEGNEVRSARVPLRLAFTKLVTSAKPL